MKISSQNNINIPNINIRVNVDIDIYQYSTHTIEPCSKPLCHVLSFASTHSTAMTAATSQISSQLHLVHDSSATSFCLVRYQNNS